MSPHDGCRGHDLVGIEDALARLDAVAPLRVERVAVTASLSRVLAARAVAACELPAFTQSAVDGYAVRHADLALGMLPVAGTVRAGALERTPQLAPGTAQRIFTGGCLPVGADAVVRQELVIREGDAIHVTRVVRPRADIRDRGEELAQGTPVAEAGMRVTPGLLAALAMAGVAHVELRAAPRIRVLVTGDEVAPPGTMPKPGQVFDANGPLVTSWLAAQGYSRVTLEYVADAAAAVRAALARALAESDLVLTTGGVSVGDHDYVPAIARELGARELFWKVRQKPGKPIFAALLGKALLLGLPGNPASVFVNLETFVRRALGRLEGLAEPAPHFATGVLERDFLPDAERDTWLRVSLRYDETGRALLGRLPRQASHMLSNLALAGGLAWIPAGEAPLPAGTRVRWAAL